MKILLKKMVHLAGFDHAVSWTVAGRTWAILAGPIGLWLVGTRLSPQQQGLYYLFANVVALKVFFEMGLSYVIMQVVSHGTAGIEWEPTGRLGGNLVALGRIGGILRVSARYYALAAGALALLLTMGGGFFIQSKCGLSFSEWGIPWMMLAVIQSIALVTTPFFAILEGLGKVGDVARTRLMEGVLATALAWIVLVAGGTLYAVPLGAGLGLVWSIGWLFFRRGGMFKALWRTTGQALSWRSEIWPFQWRIGVSWACGYFVFEAFVPMVMAYCGSVEAGRMGMSLGITTAITGTAAAWVGTKAPRLGMLVAAADGAMFTQVFHAALWRGGAVLFAGCAAALGGLLVLHHWRIPLAGRMLPPVEMLMLCGAAAANYLTSSIAVGLRAFRREPFLWVSMVNGALVLSVLWIVVPRWGTYGACAGYLAVQAGVALPWAVVLFVKNKGRTNMQGQ